MENNKLKLKIGQIRNVVIVIPLNVPDWAKDRETLLVSDGHYSISANVVPNMQIMSTELLIPFNFDINKNFVSCYEFRNEKEATKWVSTISNLIKDANQWNSNNVNDKPIKDDILWNIVY